ncbi:hypothetical protein [uncultured Draconibacterium sp.]|uniref:hypothetical protein n=1 Tax=uncultured Draconibacterium sp. TaxID=1573823 RepID=UPI003216662F
MKILRGTVFGGIAFFFLGFLVWGLLLMDFSMTNYNQDLYRPNDEMIWWAMIVSNLLLALLLTIGLKWAGAKSIVDGIKTGALFGFIYALSIDLGMYSMTNVILTLTAVVVDAFAYAAVTAGAGLVIVLTWGKEKVS